MEGCAANIMHGVRAGQAELVGYAEDEVWDHMLAPIQELEWTILPKGEPLCLIPLVPRCVPLDYSQGGGGEKKFTSAGEISTQ